jgi:hypothetical protein
MLFFIIIKQFQSNKREFSKKKKTVNWNLLKPRYRKLFYVIFFIIKQFQSNKWEFSMKKKTFSVARHSKWTFINPGGGGSYKIGVLFIMSLSTGLSVESIPTHGNSHFLQVYSNCDKCLWSFDDRNWCRFNVFIFYDDIMPCKSKWYPFRIWYNSRNCFFYRYTPD